MLYVVVDIGCLECDELSEVLGVFDNRKDAEAVRAVNRGIRDGSRYSGEHSFQLFEVPAVGASATVYPEVYTKDYETISERRVEWVAQ